MHFNALLMLNLLRPVYGHLEFRLHELEQSGGTIVPEFHAILFYSFLGWREGPFATRKSTRISWRRVQGRSETAGKECGGDEGEKERIRR